MTLFGCKACVSVKLFMAHQKPVLSIKGNLHIYLNVHEHCFVSIHVNRVCVNYCPGLPAYRGGIQHDHEGNMSLCVINIEFTCMG